MNEIALADPVVNKVAFQDGDRGKQFDGIQDDN